MLDPRTGHISHCNLRQRTDGDGIFHQVKSFFLEFSLCVLFLRMYFKGLLLTLIPQKNQKSIGVLCSRIVLSFYLEKEHGKLLKKK